MHRRNKNTRLAKRRIRRLIFSSSFHDGQRGEMICRVSREALLGLVPELTEDETDEVIPAIEKGEVLVDSRGHGSFQR